MIAGLTISTALSILQMAPKALALLPEFKAMWDRVVSSFDADADQQTLKDAYSKAIDEATDAHEATQDAAKRFGGGE